MLDLVETAANVLDQLCYSNEVTYSEAKRHCGNM